MATIDLKKLRQTLIASTGSGAVEDRVIAIVRQHAGRKRVTTKTRLIADLGLDSLSAMGIIGDVEDEFKMRVPRAALFKVETVDDIVKLIKKGK